MVAWDALASGVHLAEVVLSPGVALLGGHPVPLDRLSIIPLYAALALRVHPAEIELSYDMVVHSSNLQFP